MLLHVQQLLDQALLLVNLGREQSNSIVGDGATRGGSSQRRRRTAAGAEKIELSILLTQHIRLATVLLLRRQQEGHEVRRAGGIDIRRRLR
jgi:hypothetical protein